MTANSWIEVDRVRVWRVVYGRTRRSLHQLEMRVTANIWTEVGRVRTADPALRVRDLPRRRDQRRGIVPAELPRRPHRAAPAPPQSGPGAPTERPRRPPARVPRRPRAKGEEERGQKGRPRANGEKERAKRCGEE